MFVTIKWVLIQGPVTNKSCLMFMVSMHVNNSYLLLFQQKFLKLGMRNVCPLEESISSKVMLNSVGDVVADQLEL